MRFYLDAAVLIYLVEGIEPWESRARARLAGPQAVEITSELSVLECKVIPLRLQRSGVLADFDEFFEISLDEFLPVTRDVMERAAELRARHPSLKTPDAIHLAAALTAGCDVFLTNDRRLDRCGGAEGITVETLAS